MFLLNLFFVLYILFNHGILVKIYFLRTYMLNYNDVCFGQSIIKTWILPSNVTLKMNKHYVLDFDSNLCSLSLGLSYDNKVMICDIISL